MAGKMKLRKEIIHFISDSLVAKILDEGLIETDYSHEEMTGKFVKIIHEDLLVEDRLNDEIREILTEHSDELDSSHASYGEMFKMIKRRLVKERGLIL